MPIQVEVWGDYACFTRPEMKTERVSYDVMTPSATRGLLESIYWHPGLRWVIDRIHVCSPIRFTNIRRNEVKDVISASKVKAVMPPGASVCGRLQSGASTTVSACRIPCLSVCWTRRSAAVCKISSARLWIRSGIVCGFTTWEKSTKAKSSTLVASRHTFRKIQ